jgi:hypothetical protein
MLVHTATTEPNPDFVQTPPEQPADVPGPCLLDQVVYPHPLEELMILIGQFQRVVRQRASSAAVQQFVQKRQHIGELLHRQLGVARLVAPSDRLEALSQPAEGHPGPRTVPDTRFVLA